MKKKRAVAYVRVSSGSDTQLHSYEFQERYWRGKFTNDPENELINIYADRGISGKSMIHRPQLLAMMQDAREGRFDVIYTKSVSRFARNTVDLLTAVRELRDLGIAVIFETENINSLSVTSELYLTIAASIAENDIAVDSERMRWAYRKYFEDGWTSFGPTLYGFRTDEDGTFQQEPDEAAVVREVFDLYVSGLGCDRIAKLLNERGIKPQSGDRWLPWRITCMIRNEKYAGDTMMGKSVTTDGKKTRNYGCALGPSYYSEDTHEGIVSKEIFQAANEILEGRGHPRGMGYQNPVYPFTGLIECGRCHAKYNHKINNGKKPWRSEFWGCATSLKDGVRRCSNTRIKDDVLRQKFVEAYNEFVETRPQDEDIQALQDEVAMLYKAEQEYAALYARHLIPRDSYLEEKGNIQREAKALREIIAQRNGRLVREADLAPIQEFSPEKLQKFITKVIVQDSTVTFVFYNGASITKEYTNGQPGNKIGWKPHNREE